MTWDRVRAGQLKRFASLARRQVLRGRSGEQGAVLALVTIGSVALLGAVGLAVDGSRMMEERRHAQAAADHAAYAAAHNRCATTGSTVVTARAAGLAAATANGFDDASPRVTVTVDTTVDPSTGTTRDYEFRAAVTAEIDSTFARVLGFGAFTVSASATSAGTGCGTTSGVANPGAIYAGGICTVSGKYGIDVSGSSSQVYGGIHTNDDASVGGSGNILWEPPTPPDDPFTYVGSINSAAVQNNSFQTGYPLQVPMPSPQWPTGWAPSDLTGGTSAPPTAGSFLRPYYDLAVANGTYSASKITSITKDGVYYSTSTDGIDISSVTASGGNHFIVLVAPRGNVKVSASGPRTFNPLAHASLPRQGILMIANPTRASDKTCEDPTIMTSGSNVTWKGIMWAPSGQIEFSGSVNTTGHGALIGQSVKLNGSNLVIRNDASYFPGLTSPSITLQN